MPEKCVRVRVSSRCVSLFRDDVIEEESLVQEVEELNCCFVDVNARKGNGTDIIVSLQMEYSKMMPLIFFRFERLRFFTKRIFMVWV